MCRCNKLCFDTKIYVYSIGHYMINILYFKNHGMAKNLYYAVLIKKYVYIPYYFIHLSLLYMCEYNKLCFDTRIYLSTMKYNLLVFTTCIY